MDRACHRRRCRRRSVIAWWFLRDPIGGVDLGDQFEVERKWGWELELTEEQETALLTGLQAFYDAGNSMYVNHESGYVSMSGRDCLVSLYLLAARFKAEGAKAMKNPIGAVDALMKEFIEQEQPGVLHLRDEWYPDDEIDGMDNLAFTESLIAANERVSAANDSGPINNRFDLAASLVKDGLKGKFDDDSPYMQAYSAYEGEKSRHTNTMVLDLARVLDHYLAVRETQTHAAPKDVLATWSYGSSRPEPQV